jgi:hypothetical protein
MHDLHDLREILDRHAAHPFCEMVIPGLMLTRSDKVSSCMVAAVYSVSRHCSYSADDHSVLMQGGR